MSLIRSFGLRGQFKNDVECICDAKVLETVLVVKFLPVEFEVAFCETLVVDFVFVVRGDGDRPEACGFLDDGAVQNGVVEGGFGQACFSMFHC